MWLELHLLLNVNSPIHWHSGGIPLLVQEIYVVVFIILCYLEKMVAK